MKYIVMFSGGKDSLATVIWAKNNLPDFDVAFCDVGWENQKTYEHIQEIERWGTGEMMKAAFAGFKAIPEKASSGPSCWDVLGISWTKDVAYINRTYNQLAQRAHPDAGGSHERMVALNEARRKAIEYANS